MNWYKQANLETKTVAKEDKGDFVLHKEKVRTHHSEDFVEMNSAYAKGGCYFGDDKHAKKLFKEYGFDPDSVCSGTGGEVCNLAFSPKDQKWYGWSHRAIYGFGIGDEPSEPMWDDDQPKYKGPAKTLEQAKAYAIEFARSVS